MIVYFVYNMLGESGFTWMFCFVLFLFWSVFVGSVSQNPIDKTNTNAVVVVMLWLIL